MDDYWDNRISETDDLIDSIVRNKLQDSLELQWRTDNDQEEETQDNIQLQPQVPASAEQQFIYSTINNITNLANTIFKNISSNSDLISNDHYITTKLIEIENSLRETNEQLNQSIDIANNYRINSNEQQQTSIF